KALGFSALKLNATHLNRITNFRKLMLESERELVKAAYGLRLMRWLGQDFYSDLTWVKDILIKHGFTKEANTAQAMYGSENSWQDCKNLLDAAYEQNRKAP